MLVKCQLCGAQLDKKDVVRFEEKNYHAHCAEEMNFKMKIYSYVAHLFKFKNERKPGPVIMSQLKNFMEKYQYTYNGIYHTLVYCYDVKKMSTAKAKEGIGIVPYLYGVVFGLTKFNVLVYSFNISLHLSLLSKYIFSPKILWSVIG